MSKYLDLYLGHWLLRDNFLQLGRPHISFMLGRIFEFEFYNKLQKCFWNSHWWNMGLQVYKFTANSAKSRKSFFYCCLVDFVWIFLDSSWKNVLKKDLVFCFQNCSDPLWEKIVLVSENNFWYLRVNAEKLQILWDH